LLTNTIFKIQISQQRAQATYMPVKAI